MSALVVTFARAAAVVAVLALSVGLLAALASLFLLVDGWRQQKRAWRARYEEVRARAGRVA